MSERKGSLNLISNNSSKIIPTHNQKNRINNDM